MTRKLRRNQRATNSDVYSSPSVFRLSTVTVTIGFLLIAGCATRDPVAGLNELSKEAARNLRSNLNATLLATTIRQVEPKPPSDVPASGLCPQDWTVKFFDAQVTTPITVCSRVDETASFAPLATASSAPTTTKLTDRGTFAALEDGVKWNPPLSCRTSSGPWRATITVERGCVFTCVPLNSLTVVGVPNAVTYVWYGSFQNHPAGFEIVGTPTKIDEVDFGPCNGTDPRGGQPIP